MRALLATAVLLVGLVPYAGAQAAEPLLQDATADTSFSSGVPGAAPAPLTAAGHSESVDLVSLTVEESDELVVFHLKVAKLEGNPGGSYRIPFAWRDTEYRVSANYATSPFRTAQFAYLDVMVEEEWERLAPLLLTADPAAATLSIEVPKTYVLDGRDRSPGRGDTLGDVRVLASGAYLSARILSDDPIGSFLDQMPDDGAGAPLVLQKGDVRSGHLLLATDDRVRVSNGGSTTFVYQVTLRSNASHEDEVELSISDLPEGWNGSVQSPIKIPGGAEKVVTVLASVPFEHTHGGHDGFTLNAQSRSAAGAFAALRLGVLHTPIPQPAGHHAELYLHGSNANGFFGETFGPVFPFTSAFMNTDAKHDGDVEGLTPNDFRGGDAWRIPLNPSLRMGLDFDVEKLGLVTGTIKGGSNGEATVRAKLVLVSLDDREADGIVLAEASSAKVMLDMQKPTPFTLDLTPTEDADYVAYQPKQNIELILTMDSEGPRIGFGPVQPLLLTSDFKLTLPLNEYHDRLTGLGEAQEGLEFIAQGPVEKVGRPGTVMTYIFDIKNNGEDVTIDLDVAGNDATLGLVIPAQAFELARGATKRVTLAVQIPGDATTGAQFDVLVFAHAQEDPSKTALVRTLTSVSTGANATDDETGILFAARDAEAQTPGFVGPLAIVALGAIAVLRRRRG